MRAPSLPELETAYAGKSVLVTGHTGFKGSWLTLWLKTLGAKVTGLALPPDTRPSLFERARVEDSCHHLVGDIRELEAVRRAVRECLPEFVFHLAAQPLVRRSYKLPLETIQTNIVGTANILEALRLESHPCSIVVVTSDKCYENREWSYGYRESDPVGGHDIYSMSKAAAELVVAGYRRSFFDPAYLAQHGVALASARAGNVIGGGDWAPDRIVVDAIAALANDRAIPVRNPDAVRPWQHVLEPLGGYLLLGARLGSGHATERASFCEAWNFGPRVEDARPVRNLVEGLVEAWGSGTWDDRSKASEPHEAGLLRLAIEKAQARLHWHPRWTLEQAVARTAQWYLAHHRGATQDELRDSCLAQIDEYVNDQSASS